MRQNVAGKLRNIPLAFDKGMLPILEAIVNSLQAIGNATGKVLVAIDREAAIPGTSPGDVYSVTISDDGVGFNEENFGSFNDGDSLYKAELGGRGNGRFLWLKAFSEVSVSSTYASSDGSLRHREFLFLPTADGVELQSDEPTESGPTGTVVKLQGMRPKYSRSVPKQLETVARRVLDHCMGELLLRQEVDIEVCDVSDPEGTISIRSYFLNTMNVLPPRQITAGGHHQLQLYQVLLAPADAECVRRLLPQ